MLIIPSVARWLLLEIIANRTSVGSNWNRSGTPQAQLTVSWIGMWSITSGRVRNGRLIALDNLVVPCCAASNSDGSSTSARSERPWSNVSACGSSSADDLRL